MCFREILVRPGVVVDGSRMPPTKPAPNPTPATKVPTKKPSGEAPDTDNITIATPVISALPINITVR